jgi:curli biogenesis system outer membrane secretion channel CsgG
MELFYMQNIVLFTILSFFIGCSSHNVENNNTNTKDSIVVKKNQDNILKRKVAILRFDNKSEYGKSSIFKLDVNQAATKHGEDILYTKLAKSDKFILLERKDAKRIDQELNSANKKTKNIMADYAIVGAITEFGRRDITDRGIVSKVKTQEARAKVSLRVIDVYTKEVIFATESVGIAKNEARGVAILGRGIGIGKDISYDSSLNDKAISNAIDNVVVNMMNKMLDKPWRSYILSIDKDKIIIAGAKRQGLKIGDRFGIYKNGDKVTNPQTGIDIELPSKKVVTIEVVSQFGNSYNSEGSICKIVDGDIDSVDIKETYVQK